MKSCVLLAHLIPLLLCCFCSFSQIQPDTAFVIEERDLIPECITYDPVYNRFLIGSLYKNKINSYSENGLPQLFIRPGYEGLGPVAGIRVDNSKKLLWALSSDTKSKSKWKTAVYKFDLTSGKMLKKYLVRDSSGFNDLTLDDAGNLYITDMIGGTVYYLDAKRNMLSKLFPMGTFSFPNGIAYHDQRIYVAESERISYYDFQSKILDTLIYKDVYTGQVDGLYFYKKSLIVIQNGDIPIRQINQFFLDDELTTILSKKTLEKTDLPRSLFSPTTGTIKNDKLYYMANSQLRSFDASGKIFAWDKMKDIVIKSVYLE